MRWFKTLSDPFPRWVPFPGPPTFELAQRLELGAGDAISVRLAGREVPMDLLAVHRNSFVVQDPDRTTHIHEWAEAVSFWKRIEKTQWR